MKTEAEEYLHQEGHLSRDAARAVISEKENVLWRIEQIQASKGRPKALYPVSFQTDDPRKSDHLANPYEMGAREAGISAGADSKPRENTQSQKAAKNDTSGDTLFSRAGKSIAAEMESRKSPSNGGCEDTPIFAADEVETERETESSTWEEEL